MQAHSCSRSLGISSVPCCEHTGAWRTHPQTPTTSGLGHEEKLSLLHEWRRLTRAATFVAVLTSPAFFTILYKTYGWSLGASLVCTFIGVIAFRGLVDVLAHRLIPTPSLYGADRELLDDDIVARRRLWYWRKAFRRLVWIGGTLFGALLVINIIQSLAGHPQSLGGTLSDIGDLFAQLAPLLLVLGHPAADVVLHQLLHPLRAAALLRHQADEGL